MANSEHGSEKSNSEHDSEILKNFFGNQNSYKRSKPDCKSAFWNVPVTDVISRFDGWERRSVNVSLKRGHEIYVTLNFLQVEEIAFYKPIEKVFSAEFEQFFGFGCSCAGFSTERVRFMHITDDCSYR